LDADLVIGIAKLKTHIQSLFTGAVKNYFGCLPHEYRKQVHSLGRYRVFCEGLADILNAINPSFTFIDGIVGMEGRGPKSGNPKKLGLIMAAIDHVACDAVAMDLVGLDPKRYLVLEEARARGLGESRLEEIGISGGPLAPYRTSFTPPPHFLLNTPAFLARAVTWSLDRKPRADPDHCEACGICVSICPAEAISMSGKAFVDVQKCINCLCCMELCPHEAIHEDYYRPWILGLKKTKNFFDDQLFSRKEE
jgi:ferredoxin